METESFVEVVGGGRYIYVMDMAVGRRVAGVGRRVGSGAGGSVTVPEGSGVDMGSNDG